MQKNRTFDESVNETLETWRHIPSLKGKQGKLHFGILRILTIKGPLSTWDLAKEYLQLTEPWETWDPHRQYHERQMMNPTIYRRLKFLEEKRYVEKINTTYRITAKSLFLLIAMDPNVVGSLPLERLREMTFPSVNVPTETETFLKNFLGQNNLTQSKLDLVKETFQDPMVRKIVPFVIKNLLFSWKINLDEIAEEELFSIMGEKVRKKITEALEKGMK